jgi:methyl halide transferase
MSRRSRKAAPAVRENLKVSIEEQKQLDREAEQKEVAGEFEHSRWSDIWTLEFPPKFDSLESGPLLIALNDNGHIPNGRALVPGCGRGYDVTTLASDDRYVIGCDIVPEVVAAANERLQAELQFCEDCEVPYKPPMNTCEFRLQSFFKLDTENPENLFDFVYDHMFLNALDHRIWPQWAKKMSELIKEGGQLLVVIYPVMDRVNNGRPPFGVSDIKDVAKLLLPNGFGIKQLEIMPRHLCLEGRGGLSNEQMEAQELTVGGSSVFNNEGKDVNSDDDDDGNDVRGSTVVEKGSDEKKEERIHIHQGGGHQIQTRPPLTSAPRSAMGLFVRREIHEDYDPDLDDTDDHYL